MEDGQGVVLKSLDLNASTSRSPPSIIERLEKYMIEEDRTNRSWCIQRALDEWLKKKGY